MGNDKDPWVNPATDDTDSSRRQAAAESQQADMLRRQAEIQTQQLEIERQKLALNRVQGEKASQQFAKSAEGLARGTMGAVRGIGNAGYNAIGRPAEGGVINLFFIISVLLSWTQATLGYQGRAHVYFFILGVAGWYFIFREGAEPISRQSLEGLIKSFALAALAWYWPILFYKIPLSMLGATSKLILVAAFNPYILYFVFGNPRTPLLQRIQKIYVILLIIIAVAWGIQGLSQGSLNISPVPGVDTKAGLVMFWELVKDSAILVFELLIAGAGDIQTFFLDRIDYATGGALYQGQKDPNAQTRLGVYFTEMKSANPEIYDTDPVAVYAIIEASTLANPIRMTISCTANKEEGSPDPEHNIPSTTVIPERLSVDRRDRHDIDCMFSPGTLKAGSHRIGFDVAFDFTTNAKQLAYFVDSERAAALARNNIDILDQYGIRDKNPSAIYTDGPIMIGMGFTNQPVKISSTENYPATLGISLQSRWDGEIEKINMMKIQIPRTMRIIDGDCSGIRFTESQDGEFHVYTLANPAEIIAFKPYRSFRCPVEFTNPSGILGSSPVSSRFFQVEVNYAYVLTKELRLSILNSSIYNPYTGGSIPLPSPPIPAASPEGGGQSDPAATVPGTEAQTEPAAAAPADDPGSTSASSGSDDPTGDLEGWQVSP